MGKLKGVPGIGTVHLCIDMQRLFAPGGPWSTPWPTGGAKALVLEEAYRLVHVEKGDGGVVTPAIQAICVVRLRLPPR
jgi:hypothetical protein